MIPIKQALANFHPGNKNNEITNNGELILSQDENAFLDCLGAPKLRNTSDDAIIAALKYGMLLMGIKGDKMPLDVETILLIKTVKDNHGSLTIKELRLAFEMAAGLKLEFNPNTYQNFSVLYLNELMAAYKKWSIQAYEYLRPGGDKETEKEKMEYAPFTHRNLSVNQIRAEIQLGYENYLNGILTLPYYIPYEWLRVLIEDGFIEHDPEDGIKQNKKWNELTRDEERKLNNSQLKVWKLFEMANKRKTKAIYERIY